MRWTWDSVKARRNLRVHRVSFELAAVALGDPHLATQPDPHPDGDRWTTLAGIAGVVLFIVHTWPDEDDPDPVGRIISARRATSHERRAYEEGQG
ncbi:conserved hypothetical protein [Rhodospirillum centenum SW]|uniref:BrnT family toxin n=1 Tax=Rhodospirillum centenum (strain ATCC 51521 / SW) TaxID=414684 RepID=B6IW19_RHOCS|nr:conserved hypothetical protein [Rhodospirillum centenum SW]